MSIQAPTMLPSSEPSLFYRLTARLNVLVWKLPLPRRVLARLSTTVYRSPPMPGRVVLAILGALRSAGVRCWISGGWGLDALAGERTRTHRDLDLLVDHRDAQLAMELFAELGFRQWYEADSDLPLETRVVLQAGNAGLVVDLHPVDLSRMHIELSSGIIDGQPVLCISAEAQRKLHMGFRARRADLALLRRLPRAASTTLVVPIGEAEALLDGSAHEAGMPAHIELVLPVHDRAAIDGEMQAALASLLAETPPFDFELSEIGRFPGVIHLRPEPAAPFLALARALAERWPRPELDVAADQEVIPHLPVVHGKVVPGDLAERLPVRARAKEAWLMDRDAGEWTCRRRFRLGG